MLLSWKMRVKLFSLLLLLVPLSAYAAGNLLQNQATNNPLYALGTEATSNSAASGQQPVAVETKQENFMGKISGFTQSFKSNGGYLDFGLRTGYIYGQNSYNLNNRVSELEFPFRAYLGGGNISLGYKDLSFNSEFWGSLLDDPSAGWHMKDKDWDGSGNLFSDTKSKSDMNATIWDANLRYNFLNHSFLKQKTDTEAEEKSNKAINLKLGFLIGYRYERFGYKGFGLYQTGYDDASYGDGQEVFEYKIKYKMPYYGMGLDVGTDKFGFLMNAKYAFSPHVRDYDNHVLRSLEFYGDYKKNANIFMANFVSYWNFQKNWHLNLGADVALMRLNGVTWDETHNPSWDSPQSLDTKQFIYWVGLGYKF